jgi:hypothetical protein
MEGSQHTRTWPGGTEPTSRGGRRSGAGEGAEFGVGEVQRLRLVQSREIGSLGALPFPSRRSPAIVLLAGARGAERVCRSRAVECNLK